MLAETAYAVGAAVAAAESVLVCGGLGGVMAAACRGAREAGGTTLGLLPGLDRTAANRWVELAVPTGLGELRNGLVVRAADGVLVVGGGWGTLSEVAFARKAGRSVVIVGDRRRGVAGLGYAGDEIEWVSGPAEAVRRALSLA